MTDGLSDDGRVQLYLARMSEDRAKTLLEHFIADSEEITEPLQFAGSGDQEIKALHDALVQCLAWITQGEPGVRLTPRETQCLEACAAGKTYWETGKIIGISERTVIFHMQSVREKLTAATNAEAVAKAVRTGLV